MEKMVTRTIDETRVKYLTIDTDGQSVIEGTVTLPGKFKNDEKLAKALRVKGVEYARITAVEIGLRRYGCTESKFMSIARELPLLKKVPENEIKEEV